MEQKRAEAGEQQGGLDAQGQAVAADQDGHQNGGAKHGEHMLQAQHQHFGDAQLARVVDGLRAQRLFFVFHDSSSSIFFKKQT